MPKNCDRRRLKPSNTLIDTSFDDNGVTLYQFLFVAACKHKRLGLQTSRFSAQINCNRGSSSAQRKLQLSSKYLQPACQHKCRLKLIATKLMLVIIWFWSQLTGKQYMACVRLALACA